jgi:hypothetical protein
VITIHSSLLSSRQVDLVKGLFRVLLACKKFA